MGGVIGRADWVSKLHGRLVALDTAPLIYFIEEHPTYLTQVEPFFEALDRGELRVVTSTVTLLEVLVQPLRQGDLALMARYRAILLGIAGLDTIPVSTAIAEEAARLRATHRLAAPDAIQLATAFVEGADAFLTNDIRFPRPVTPQVLVLDEL
jgi:predicted nucleic acid-binding protein